MYMNKQLNKFWHIIQDKKKKLKQVMLTRSYFTHDDGKE